MQPAERGNDLPPDDDDDDAPPSGDFRGNDMPGDRPAGEGEGPRRRGRRGGRGRGRGEGAAAGAAAGAAPAPREGGRGEGRGPRPEGRDGGRGRGPRTERPSVAPGERARGVSDDEAIRIPDAPEDAPNRPAGEYADELDLAGSTLRDVLNLLGLPGTEITARNPETPGDGAGLVAQVFEIFGENDVTSDELGLLIGRRGETLSSLQYLVNTIVSHTGENAPVYGIDIEGYRRRREQTLVDLAKEVAQEVRETGDVITLEPMPAAERRIVHLALEQEPGVRTESVGSGDRRQVEVMPAEE